VCASCTANASSFAMLLVARTIHSLHRLRIRPQQFDAPNAVRHADTHHPQEQTQGCWHCRCPANAQQRTAKLLVAGLNNRPHQAKAGKAGTPPF
jgi:hypothetical protein